jgi:ribonucleoside-diphosphate reductase alpha chain
MALTEVTPEIDNINSASPLAGGAGAPKDPTATGMKIKKRNGTLEPCDVNKIVRAIARCAVGLDRVESLRVAMRTIAGLHDGATTEELDRLSIQTAAALVVDEPEYSKLASRLLATFIDKEVRNQGIQSFSQAIAHEHQHGLVNDDLFAFVNANARKLDDAIEQPRNWLFEYFGLRTVADRYLLRHPETRKVVETPQYFFLRVACGLSDNVREAIDFYNLISSLAYLPSSPTLFNSGTLHTQMSSCYLLDSPQDSLDSIYDRYKDVARLSKHAGGIGLSYTRIRSRGSLIKGTNGLSNGIVPWLKTLDSSVMAVNQGGRRKGAACVYLETWHADIEEFLELRDNTGDENRRTHNLNLANWVPDLFMERVESDGQWSLFDPKEVPELVDTYGDEFEKIYTQAEADGRYVNQVNARELYGAMMRTLAQTGNGWMTFKDASNKKSNQTGATDENGNPNVIHLSNLCTEILEVTSDAETAVCNLGSINLSKFVDNGEVAYDRIGEVVRTAVTFLDRVIDRNWYPTETSQASNARWRPVGLGMMGLQDVFFQLHIPFDSEEARKISARISEEIYYNAIVRSIELAEEFGPHAAFEQTRAAQGKFQFDLWEDAQPQEPERFEALRDRMMKSGLRNSLIIAIAPTATIASIAGCYECIEPQVSNLFKRETLSGEFLQVNNYLIRDLQARNLWTDSMRDQIKQAEGSIQDIADIPAELREVYRTAWEIPMRSLIDMAADRGAFIDQSQSLNLFMETPTIGKLSSMYMYAWQKGIKTTYYLRSRPATRIRQTTVTEDVSKAPVSDGTGITQAPDETVDVSLAEKIACSLENPESCESCQ